MPNFTLTPSDHEPPATEWGGDSVMDLGLGLGGTP